MWATTWFCGWNAGCAASQRQPGWPGGDEKIPKAVVLEEVLCGAFHCRRRQGNRRIVTVLNWQKQLPPFEAWNKWFRNFQRGWASVMQGQRGKSSWGGNEYWTNQLKRTILFGNKFICRVFLFLLVLFLYFYVYGVHIFFPLNSFSRNKMLNLRIYGLSLFIQMKLPTTGFSYAVGGNNSTIGTTDTWVLVVSWKGAWDST